MQRHPNRLTDPIADAVTPETHPAPHRRSRTGPLAGTLALALVFGLATAGYAETGTSESGQQARDGNDERCDRDLHRHRHGKRNEGGFMMRLLERGDASRLGLDETTQEEARSILEASRERSAPIRDARRAARAALNALVAAPVIDEPGVLAKSAEIGQLDDALRDIRIRARLEVASLLTPEQRAELAAMKSDRHERRKKRRAWRRSRVHDATSPEDAG